MRKHIVAWATVFILGTVSASQAQIWNHMLTPSANVSGTRYVGDTFNNGSTWNLQFEIGQASWNASEAGIGPSNTDPAASGWNWGTATYYADGSSPNKQVQRNIGSVRLTTSGTWYFSGRAKANSGDAWTYANSTTWANTTTFSPSYSFSVTALVDPTVGTLTADSGSQITLNWTRGVSGSAKDTLIVRSTDASFGTPTAGTGYSAGNTISGDTVVYNGNGTTFADTGLSAGTTYYYKFYAVNNNYYSSGNTGNQTTLSTPTITVAAGTIAFTNVPVNGTSGEQTYTVSGANLTANITVTAPSGFEVSTSSGSGFGSSVTLTQSGGSVANTTIYVRFKPTAVTSYSANITHASTGATTQNKALTGTGIAPVDPAAFSAAGGALQNTLTFTLGADSKPVVIVRNTSGTFSSPSGAPPALGGSLAGGTVVYNGSTSPQTDTGLSAGTLYYYKAFSYDSVGNFYSAGLTANATTAPGAPTASAAGTIGYTNFNANWSAASGATGYRLDVAYDSSFSSLVSGFNNLDVGNVTTYTVKPIGGIGQYFYRVRAYNTAGTSANSSTIAVSTLQAQGRNGNGNASPQVTPSPAYVGDTLTFNFDTWGTVSGNWGAPALWTHTSADVQNGSRGAWGATVNTDNKSLTRQFTSAGTYYWGVQMNYFDQYGTNCWLVRDNGATWQDLYYKGTNGNLTVTINALSDPTSLAITTNSSTQLTPTWTKWNSRDVLVVRSLDASFTAPTPGASYTAGNSIGGDTVVYKGSGTSVADSGLTAGTVYYYKLYSENFSYYSAGAVVSGTTPGSPTITVAAGTLAFGSQTTGTTSSEQTYTVSGVNLTANIVVTAPSGYEVSTTSGSGFGGSVTLTQSGGTVGSTTIYVRFAPGSSGTYNANITHTSTGATTQNKALTGTAVDPTPAAPVASAASSVGYTSFYANWAASTYATSYRLDVATDSAFTQLVSSDVNVGNVTTYQITGLVVGQYFYRVRAVNGTGTSGNSSTITVNLSTAQGVNGGGTPPAATVVEPSTLYVGDTGTFAVKAWGDISGNWAKWRVVIDTDNNIINGGVRGSWTASFNNSEYKQNTSPQFTSAGTWYWGMQIDYGSPYGTNFWMVRDQADWANLYYFGTNVNLSVTVTALGDPTGVNAVKDGTYPSERIDLSWTRWNSRDVMVVRSLDNVFTAPTPGQTYTAGNTIGGDTVVYKGSGTSFEDTGLSASTTYYYRYYSENYGYYSDSTGVGANDSETTDAAPAPSAPVATAASSLTISGFTANWNASAGATSYRLDVSSNATFTSIHPSYNDLNVGNVTTYAVSGLTVGPYYYRVRAVSGGGTSADSNVIGTGTTTGQARNKNGVSPPYYRNLSNVDNGTIYVGDTVTVGADLWGQVNSQNGAGRAVIHTTTTLQSGLYGAWGSADATEYTEATTPKFTSGGTWYWGIQMSYGSAGTNFWYVKNDNNWHDQYYAGTNATIAVTVTALQPPTGITAITNTANPQSQVDLAWTRWNSRDVMIVRSTDNSFGTPTPNTVYSAGNTISGDTVVYKGSGTTFTDTGLGAGSTYYYRLYSENYGYYSDSSGSSANTNVTMEGSAPSAPTANAATLVTTASFQANWSAPISGDQTGYRLDVANDAGFSSLVSGYNNLNVNNVTAYSVSGLTAGNTYYYRVRAYNGAGTSANSGSTTVTLPATATVTIEDIPASGASTNLSWTATVGAKYDIYQSDSDPSGSMTWNPVASGVTATSNPMTYPVPEDNQRYYRVVINGASASTANSPVWGVIKPTVASGFSMMSAPLDISDRTISGELGNALKAVLNNGSKIHILESDGSFTTITLTGGNWDSDYTLAEGQGFFVENATGSAVNPRFDGPVGNDGSATRTINGAAQGRWNILGLSQGKTLSFSSAFANGNFNGSPTANWDETVADMVVIDQGNGNWKRILRGGDGAWYDLDTFSTPSINLAPGSAVYYFHYGTGSLSIDF